MSLIVDLVESAPWVNSTAKWPSWLDKAWQADNSARFVCRLSHPDDLSALRSLIPDPDHLLAYPSYGHLAEHLTQDEYHRIYSTFLECLGAENYIKLTPGGSTNALPEPERIPRTPRHRNGRETSLAVVSPLPPTPSGIAIYCADLLPTLAESYRITLVVADPAQLDPAVASDFEVISHTQFLRVGSSFDRVMYHFGNAIFHYEYFTLLKAHPGVVVLHDIYLGDCIFSNFEQLGTSELRQQIYASHGWPALLDCEGPIKQAIALYPACASLLSESHGVLVHSHFAKENLSLFFGDSVQSNVAVSPLARRVKELPDKQVSRRHLNISSEARVYASFGLINWKKCGCELIEAWGASDLARDSSVKLYLVGGFSDAEIEKRINDAIAALPVPEQVISTGFVDNATYDAYLSAADIAIQLRRNSCGESSAALLDCMAAGLTTIINAHGSMAEMPDNTVVKLADEFSEEDLRDSLNFTYASFDTLFDIGKHARSYVEEHHSLYRTAASYSDFMESCYLENPKVLVNALHSSLFAPKLRDLSPSALWSCIEDLNDFMSCTGRVGSSMLAGSQLLVDISAVVQHDHKSGIQRVVRNTLKELLQKNHAGYRVEAVYYDFASQRFRYARSFTSQFLNLSPLYLSDDPVEVEPGDIYLGLDLAFQIASEETSRRWLQFMRGRGVKIYYVLYDLLPISLPRYFPATMVTSYSHWLESITKVSDGVIAISRSVADEYRAWLTQARATATTRPKIGYFHLGADMESHGSRSVTNHAEKRLLETIKERNYLLMVGTIEPRKGHRQVLDAFDKLWSQGVDLSLVVVGPIGWVDDRLARRVKNLATETNSFHWLNYVSDAMLEALYEQASGTIMASFGEGFGLPLIEAAYYGSSLLARDLPVFREVCGDHAWYFKASDGEGLADELREWLSLYTNSSQPDSAGIEWNHWRRSAAQLLANVIHNHWYDEGSNP